MTNNHPIKDGIDNKPKAGFGNGLGRIAAVARGLFMGQNQVNSSPELTHVGIKVYPNHSSVKFAVYTAEGISKKATNELEAFCAQALMDAGISYETSYVGQEVSFSGNATGVLNKEGRYLNGRPALGNICAYIELFAREWINRSGLKGTRLDVETVTPQRLDYTAEQH